VGLERGPLSLVSTIEELLGRKSSGSGLENLEYDLKDPSRWQRGTLYPQKLALTSPSSGGSSVGVVRSLTQATEFNPFYNNFDPLSFPNLLYVKRVHVNIINNISRKVLKISYETGSVITERIYSEIRASFYQFTRRYFTEESVLHDEVRLC
jgi:hypothetical protein